MNYEYLKKKCQQLVKKNSGFQPWKLWGDRPCRFQRVNPGPRKAGKNVLWKMQEGDHGMWNFDCDKKYGRFRHPATRKKKRDAEAFMAEARGSPGNPVVRNFGAKRKDISPLPSKTENPAGTSRAAGFSQWLVPGAGLEPAHPWDNRF